MIEKPAASGIRRLPHHQDVVKVATILLRCRYADFPPFAPPALRSDLRCLAPGRIRIGGDHHRSHLRREHQAAGEIACADRSPRGEAEQNAGTRAGFDAFADHQPRCQRIKTDSPTPDRAELAFCGSTSAFPEPSRRR